MSSKSRFLAYRSNKTSYKKLQLQILH